VSTGQETVYEIDSVPETFSQEDRENVLMVGDLHAMDPQPGERLPYIREVCDDLNRALEKYNSNKVVFNGDTGSADHLGAVLDYLDATEVVFLEGDEDRKRNEERDYIGWAETLEKDGEPFDTEVDYMLEDERVRLDEKIDLPGSYPVQVQHFPRECRESKDETGFEAFWFSDQELFDVFGYAVSPTLERNVQAAFHSHVHGYNTRVVGKTALTSLGPLGDAYVTDDEYLPESSIQAVSFGKNDFEIVHEDRETGEPQESQKFRRTKKGFRKVKSRGKDHLFPLQRFKKAELPPSYLHHLQSLNGGS
jgi:hypothetical protein